MRLFGSLSGAILIWAGLLCLVLEILGAAGYFSGTFMWGIEFQEFYQYTFLLLGMIIFIIVGSFLFYLNFMQGLKPTDDVSFSRLILFFFSGLTSLFLLIFIAMFVVGIAGFTEWTINGNVITGSNFTLLYILIIVGLLILTFVSIYLGYYGSGKARAASMPMVPPETLNTITKMAAWAGMTTEELDNYVMSRYNKQLHYLSISEVEHLISDLKEKAKQKTAEKRSSRL